MVALTPSARSLLHARIADRFKKMLADGLTDELAALRQRYRLTPGMPSMRTVGYRQAWAYLDGEIDGEELLETRIAATRQLAKRQLCLVPAFGGTLLAPDSKEALWDRFYMAAPLRQRQCVEQYKIVKRA